jgi:hypothetical protein
MALCMIMFRVSRTSKMVKVRKSRRVNWRFWFVALWVWNRDICRLGLAN